MGEWVQPFKFAPGDRVRIAVPEGVGEDWPKFGGRYGTVGKLLFETQAPPHDPTFLRYRIDLETAPRGSSHIRWVREEWLAKAKEKKGA
jgi:hypothetical protein